VSAIKGVDCNVLFFRGHSLKHHWNFAVVKLDKLPVSKRRLEGKIVSMTKTFTEGAIYMTDIILLISRF